MPISNALEDGSEGSKNRGFRSLFDDLDRDLRIIIISKGILKSYTYVLPFPRNADLQLPFNLGMFWR